MNSGSMHFRKSLLLLATLIVHTFRESLEMRASCISYAYNTYKVKTEARMR